MPDPTFIVCPKCGRKLYRFLRVPKWYDPKTGNDFEPLDGMPSLNGRSSPPCPTCGAEWDRPYHWEKPHGFHTDVGWWFPGGANVD
ncbi:MAG: hypothetical protein AB1760_00250 [Pseudomonadota bacterium]